MRFRKAKAEPHRCSSRPLIASVGPMDAPGSVEVGQDVVGASVPTLSWTQPGQAGCREVVETARRHAGNLARHGPPRKVVQVMVHLDSPLSRSSMGSACDQRLDASEWDVFPGHRDSS
mgnify:CR=1 FL=1